MGLTTPHALSRLLQFFVKEESVAGTFEPPIGTDAAKVLKTDFSLEQERVNIEVSRQTRSLLERCTRRANVVWSVEAEVRPSGTAGTPPDLHALFKALMGSYTNTPATSDAYTLANSQTPPTVSMYRVIPGIFSESVWGAWVNAFTLSSSGTDKPTVKFDGGAMQLTPTGYSTESVGNGGSTTITPQAADFLAFGLNSMLEIEGDDNSGAGYQVTSYDSGDTDFTIDTSIVANIGDTLVPWGPTETVAGSPLCGIKGSLTYDSDSPLVTGIELSMDNGFRPIDDEAFAQYVSDFVPGYRSVTGQLTMRARRDWIYHWANRKTFQTRDLQIVLGTVAGSILTLDLNTVELDFAPVDIPAGDGDVILTLPFTALGSGSGENEFSMTFT